MSGIFKGDSIYKSGGGGGGYKNGGQLVDGDFIKVENNTVSSYDNVSRDPVNFYFEVKDGEVLNSVVELTTAVNATINVYVLKNGLYFLLGNIGGNTVNAGEDYKVNITGDSFDIEDVTTPAPDPEFAEIDGGIYGIKKIGSLLWLKSNYTGFRGSYVEGYGTRYYKFSDFVDLDLNGWRLPNQNDINNLTSLLGSNPGTKLKSTSGWFGGGNGTNESELDFYPYNEYNNGLGAYSYYSYFWAAISNDNTKIGRVNLTYTSSNLTVTQSDKTAMENIYRNVRLVHEV